MRDFEFLKSKFADEWSESLFSELAPVLDAYKGIKYKKLRIAVSVDYCFTLQQYKDCAIRAGIHTCTKEFVSVWVSVVHHRLLGSDEHFHWHEAELFLGMTNLRKSYDKVIKTKRYDSIMASVVAIMPQ